MDPVGAAVRRRSSSKSKAGAGPSDHRASLSEPGEPASVEESQSEPKPVVEGDGLNFGCVAAGGIPLLPADSSATVVGYISGGSPDAELSARCRSGRHRSATLAQCVRAAVASSVGALEDAAETAED